MLIRSATDKDYKILARKHMEVFPGFFLSSLGESFLRTYYKALFKLPETICFFAEEDRQVVGYVVGKTRTSGFLKRVVKSSPIPFAFQGFKLLFTRPAALMRLMRNLEKKSNDSEITDDQEYGEIALIGVSPEMKGKGIGRALLNTLEECLRSKSVEKLSLTTDFYNNDTTLMAYKAWGFNVLYEFTAYPNRKMYRLIKTIS